ncbi:hypothetical protein POM88_020102 [Heracleum sosnowskyi]|uniref:Uncharacterized protein n=1 Tax=Heracleum sosnowskyi TaxID=360622 RepID=A0AAD8MRI1_9APIA|nr:hypothetical protein POM88_020102 [Heracleum sosnowskyi]
MATAEIHCFITDSRPESSITMVSQIHNDYNCFPLSAHCCFEKVIGFFFTISGLPVTEERTQADIVNDVVDAILLEIKPNILTVPENAVGDVARNNSEHDEPGNHSRLWLPGDIRLVLKNNKGTGAIEGYYISNRSSEANIVNEVVDRVLLELNPTSFSVAKYPVGLDSRVEDITTLLSSDTVDLIESGDLNDSIQLDDPKDSIESNSDQKDSIESDDLKDSIFRSVESDHREELLELDDLKVSDELEELIESDDQNESDALEELIKSDDRKESESIKSDLVQRKTFLENTCCFM